MDIIWQSHDKFFRAALKNSEVAKEYFEQYLPADLVNVIDLNQLEPHPEIHVNKKLARYESDTIYKTVIHGELGYICLAAEHQTEPDRFMPLRLLAYNVAIWEADRAQRRHAKKLPFIVNIVFYTGKGPYTYSTDFKDLLDAPKELIDAYWDKPFTLVQAKDIPDKVLLEQKWSGLFMYLMKNIRSRDLMPYLINLMPLMKAIDAQHGIAYLDAAMHYALSTGEISDIAKLMDMIQRELSKEAGEQIMTGAQQLINSGIEQGIQKGIEQGIQKGTLKGERLVLIRLLERKFGVIPRNYLSQLDKFSSDALLDLSEKFLDAQSLEDLFQ